MPNPTTDRGIRGDHHECSEGCRYPLDVLTLREDPVGEPSADLRAGRAKKHGENEIQGPTAAKSEYSGESEKAADRE